MAAQGAIGVLVIPVLLLLAAMSVAFPGATFKILAGGLLTIALLAFFLGGARQGVVRVRAVAPAQAAPIEADVRENNVPAVEIIEE